MPRLDPASAGKAKAIWALARDISEFDQSAFLIRTSAGCSGGIVAALDHFAYASNYPKAASQFSVRCSCHQRCAFAMGGLAAQVPSRTSEEANRLTTNGDGDTCVANQLYARRKDVYDGQKE